MSTLTPSGRANTTAARFGPDRLLLEAIAEALPRLRRSEQKVARAVLDDPHRAVHASMAELARAAGVSEPTVMRFCTAMECDGFQGFKLRLAQSVAFGVPASISSIKPDDDTTELVEKIFDFTMASMARARSQLDDRRVAEAIDVLAAATDILFLGFGASAIVAQDAQQKFPLFGVPCMAPTDAHQQFIAASLCRPGSAVVAISNTGTTTAVLESVEVARKGGAKVIGITGSESPLSQRCDVPLIVETLENTDFFTPMHSRLAQLAVIDVLATGAVLRLPAEQLERARVAKAEVAAMRSGPSRLLDELDRKDA